MKIVYIWASKHLTEYSFKFAGDYAENPSICDYMFHRDVETHLSTTHTAACAGCLAPICKPINGSVSIKDTGPV